MNELIEKLPETLRGRFESISGLIDAFCDTHLDGEYRQLSREMLLLLCEEDVPIHRGRPASWACGIVYALGRVNFLDDPDVAPHMTWDEVAKGFGVSKGTMSAKSTIVRETLELIQLDPRWCLPSRLADNPLVWMVELTGGIIIDIRHAPREAQEAAYQKGLIPFIPGDPEGCKQNMVDRLRTAPGQTSGDGAARRAKRKVPKGGLYTFNVSIIEGTMTEEFFDANPRIARTIQIRGDQTLDDLHDAIFDAFDRFDEHLYEFQFSRKQHDPAAQRYVLPTALDDSFGPEPAGDLTRATIGSLGLKVKQSFLYWFDFGDDWWHQIDVLAINEKSPKGKFPKVTESIGASPPQYVDWDEEE